MTRKSTLQEQRPHQLIVCVHRCRSAFCPRCSRILGRKLLRELIPVVATFKHPVLLTLTLDRQLFANPAAALKHVREQQVVAKTLQDLWRQGRLASRRYFWVIEFFDASESFHLHALVDGKRIPQDAVARSWSKHRPTAAGPPLRGRPAFGWVRVTEFRANQVQRAASYILKQFLAPPPQGFPSWVLAHERQVRRHGTSRGVWGKQSNRRTSKPGGSADAGHRRPRRTHGERAEQCGKLRDVYQVIEITNRKNGKPKRRLKRLARDYDSEH